MVMNKNSELRLEFCATGIRRALNTAQNFYQFSTKFLPIHKLRSNATIVYNFSMDEEYQFQPPSICFSSSSVGIETMW